MRPLRSPETRRTGPDQEVHLAGFVPQRLAGVVDEDIFQGLLVDGGGQHQPARGPDTLQQGQEVLAPLSTAARTSRPVALTEATKGRARRLASMVSLTASKRSEM